MTRVARCFVWWTAAAAAADALVRRTRWFSTQPTNSLDRFLLLLHPNLIFFIPTYSSSSQLQPAFIIMNLSSSSTATSIGNLLRLEPVDRSVHHLPAPGHGSGSKLPTRLLWSASLSAALATLLSLSSIVRQLRNYRKPILQRFVVRILFMVPIYSISTLISLYSLQTAFFIDLIRDIYEAFVIYCFFGLLVEYLGGQRSLLILLHGRQPTPHPWPISKCISPIDISDPYTFLNIKRGIFQYVQVKPVLVIFTVIFKATKTYNDGDLKLTSGYTYVSIAYNFSVSLCLYCLAAFWMCTAADLKPFRPMPKFLCIKGIIFFSFWQGFGISILVALGLLSSTRYATETLSLAIQDTLICFEMPLFSILHLYAFSHHDFIEPGVAYCGRLPFVYAFRDSILGFKDVLEDSLTTLRGSGFSYKTFEPSEGALHHQGIVRERRVRAGLRYSAGGKQKYWLPMAGENEGRAHGRKTLVDEVPEARNSRLKNILHRINPIHHDQMGGTGYAPLLPDQAAEIVHEERVPDDESERRPLTDHRMGNIGRWDFNPMHYGLHQNDSDDGSDLEEVTFGEPRKEEEDLYQDARRLTYGDYNNPVVDASQEEASRLMRAMEDGMLASHPAAPSSKKGKARQKSLTSMSTSLLHSDDRIETSVPSSQPGKTKRDSILLRLPPRSDSKVDRKSKTKRDARKDRLPEGCVDLLIEDREATEGRARRNRLKGEANRFTSVSPQKVFKVIHPELSIPAGSDRSRRASENGRRSDPRRLVDGHPSSHQGLLGHDPDQQGPIDEDGPRRDADESASRWVGEVRMIVDMQEDVQATQIDSSGSSDGDEDRAYRSDASHPPSPPPDDRRWTSDLVEGPDDRRAAHDHRSAGIQLSSSLIRNPWDG